jgi:hypothetical protein
MFFEVERLNVMPSEGGLACHRPDDGYVVFGEALRPLGRHERVLLGITEVLGNLDQTTEYGIAREILHKLGIDDRWPGLRAARGS